MNYIWHYKTEDGLDNLSMTSDGEYLTALWFDNTDDALNHNVSYEEKNLEIFRETCKWLDIYFSGKEPEFTPKYKIENITPFRSEVTNLMNKIPYGKLTTYNDIAKKIAKKRGIKKMSAQAVGGAVGYNPICIIIPCHRVVGSNGNLVEYGGGLNNKIELLKRENIDIVDNKYRL